MIIDDIWRIAIGNSLPEVKQDWINKGYIINHFEAITPKTMRTDLPFGFGYKNRAKTPEDYIDFTDTEKAVFCSHFTLWEKCYTSQRPMFIIEHDVKLRGYLPREWNVNRLKYFTKGALPDRSASRPKYTPAAGYVLTPHGAKVLISEVKDKFVSANVDSYIYRVGDNNPTEWIVAYADQVEHNLAIEHDEY